MNCTFDGIQDCLHHFAKHSGHKFGMENSCFATSVAAGIVVAVVVVAVVVVAVVVVAVAVVAVVVT